MNRWAFILFVSILAGCSSPTTSIQTKSSEASPERRTESTTFWSNRTELFLEFPELVQGEGSRFAIHFTSLDDFKPLSAGRCEVLLKYDEGGEDTFSTEAPSRPGIFGVTVKPTKSGKATLEIALTSPKVSDRHVLKDVTIYAELSKAPTGEEPVTEETMPFLKEQQWALDFATSLAETGTVRESFTVPAEVSVRSSGQADVVSPLAGRLAGDDFPILGARATQGQLLASIIPPTGAASDRAGLDLARSEAETALAYAHKDQARAARLVEAGAAPRKRLDEAQTAEALAQARLKTADERIRQFESSRLSEGAAGSPSFSIRAPISGTIVEASAAPGANLKGGEVLFRIVDTSRVYISAIVPEAEYPKARQLSGSEVEIPGLDHPLPAGRLITIGKIVDVPSRTFPVVYEFNNDAGRIAINQTVTIRLFFAGSRKAVLVPESALVDDAGRPVVFIQREGEAFVRRPVTVGYREDGKAEIVSGVEAGDRIVTKGAYLIRLSALSTAIPAHGHVH